MPLTPRRQRGFFDVVVRRDFGELEDGLTRSRSDKAFSRFLDKLPVGERGWGGGNRALEGILRERKIDAWPESRGQQTVPRYSCWSPERSVHVIEASDVSLGSRSNEGMVDWGRDVILTDGSSMVASPRSCRRTRTGGLIPGGAIVVSEVCTQPSLAPSLGRGDPMANLGPSQVTSLP